MDDQAEVLQQRIQVLTICGYARQQARERVRREQREGEKAHADKTHDGQYTRQHHQRQLRAEHGHSTGPEGENQRPQQQRALVITPHSGELVVPGQQAVAVVGDHLYRKIVLQEGPGEAGKAERGKDQYANREIGGQRHGGDVALPATPQRNRAQQHGQAKRQDEGEVTQLRDHWPYPCSPLCSAMRDLDASSASATSGGM